MRPDLSIQFSIFLSGALFAGFLVAGLFFLKFWRRSRDVLFLCFALAFGIFAAERLVLLALQTSEHRGYVYLLRLAGYLFILGGIVLKNRRRNLD